MTKSVNSPVLCWVSLLALTLAAGLSGCATPPADPAQRTVFEQANDPYEPLNRAVFDFNDNAYTYLLFPVADAYAELPTPARDGLHNISSNLGEPVVFMNKALQGDATSAGGTAARFLVNSIFGFGGLIDVASHNDLAEPKRADFGATLHSYGVDEGPYLVLPLFGPSNPRDAIGFAVDGAAEPWGYVLYTTYPEQLGVAFGKNIDILGGRASDYRNAKSTSLDFYAYLRSSFRQNRRFDLGDKSNDDSLYDVPGNQNDHP